MVLGSYLAYQLAKPLAAGKNLMPCRAAPRSSVVDLLAIHEKAYLEHCRLYALNESH
jgi:hypothetical protein